jgi:hypothetical protein
MNDTVASKIACCVTAWKNCVKSGNDVWEYNWDCMIDEIEKNILPHGSGFNGKMEISRDETNFNRIVINAEYLKMNENGYYDGWITFKVIAYAQFHGIDIRITGLSKKDKNECSEYFGDIFHCVLSSKYIEKGETK